MSYVNRLQYRNTGKNKRPSEHLEPDQRSHF